MESVLVLLAVILCFWLAFHLTLLRTLRAPRRSGGDMAPGMRRETIAAVNGRALSLRWWPQSRPDAPAVLIMHGWGGYGGELIGHASRLHHAGYAVLLPDARCHGDSADDSFASLPRFAEDVESALGWLRERVPGAPCILVGHSLGGAACLLVASRRRDITAVVSISAFAHPQEMMNRWLQGYGRFGRWLGRPVLAYVQWVIGQRFDRIAAVNTARRLHCPLLVIHGARDETVPVEDARRIAAAAGTLPVLQPDADHEHFDEPALAQAIFGFVARHDLAPKQHAATSAAPV